MENGLTNIGNTIELGGFLTKTKLVVPLTEEEKQLQMEFLIDYVEKLENRIKSLEIRNSFLNRVKYSVNKFFGIVFF